MDGDIEKGSKSESPTQEELRQRRLAYFGTRSLSKDDAPADNINPVSKAPPQTVTQLQEKNSKSTDRDAGGWDSKTFSTRDLQNDDFDQLKEQLKQQTLTSNEDGYNELVERLIQCAKRDIIEREDSVRSERLGSIKGFSRSESFDSIRHRDSGDIPVEPENGGKTDYPSNKQKHTQSMNEVHHRIQVNNNENGRRGNVNDAAVSVEGLSNKPNSQHPADQVWLSLKDSQDLEQLNYFQKSVDFDHMENVGLQTHRPESNIDEMVPNTQEQQRESLEEKIRKKSPRVLDGIVANDLKGALGEKKYKAFLEKSIKEIDELQQGQNSDRSQGKHPRKPPKKLNNFENQSQSRTRKTSSSTPLDHEKSENLCDNKNLNNTDKDTGDVDSSTVVNGSLTDITQTEYDGGQEPARPLLNRPKYDPIRNLYQQNEEGKDSKESPMLTQGSRNYEQVTVPRNVVFSASQIYQQAYKGGPSQLSGYEGMPPAMFPYHPDMAVNPAMMQMGGHSYGNMYEAIQHNPYYPNVPFQGPPASPVHGSFVYPPYPMQNHIPNLPLGPGRMSQPSEQVRAVDSYLQQLSARSCQSHEGSDSPMYNQYPTSYPPVSKVPHPPEQKSISNKKPPLPNNASLKSSTQSMKLSQSTPIFYPPEFYQHHPQVHLPHPRGSQSGEVPGFQNYMQHMTKGIPYPPPPENVDLQAYFQYLGSQGYPVPYQMMPPKHPGVEQFNVGNTEGGPPQVPFEVPVIMPRPPSQSKKTTASPRNVIRHENNPESKKQVDGARQTLYSNSMDGKAALSSQRHVEGIRQYHEQRRQQQEDEEVLEKQRVYAKASIDRYFNSLENLYRREKANREDCEEDQGVGGEDQRENIAEKRLNDDLNTMVNTEVTVATMEAGGITDRIEKLGIDLSFLKDGKDQESEKSEQTGQKEDKTKDKRVIVCPECGEINKPYMTWCADCGDVLIGVEPILPTKKKHRDKARNDKTEKRQDNKNVTFNEKTDNNSYEEIVVTNNESPVYGSSPKGKFSPNKSESRDSGRPSSEDLDFGRTEKEVIDVCESIDDPVVREFIKSYFNRKRQALEETRKSLEGEFKEASVPLKLKTEKQNSQPPSRDTEISIDCDDLEYLKREDMWLHERVDVEVENKPLRGKKSGPLDIEVFSVEESRQSRNSSRVECVVPMLNLVNSSDEDEEEETDTSKQGPLRPPPVDMSVDSEDWHQMFELKERPHPLVPPLIDQTKDEDNEKGLLEQIIEQQEVNKKPPPSGESNGRKGSGNRKSKVRSSIEAPGYQRRWEKSSIAWSSYKPRELSTNSSVKGPQSSKSRSNKSSHRPLSHSVSVDSCSQQDPEEPTRTEGAGRGRKPRPASADIYKRKQRPTSSHTETRKSLDLNGNSADQPNSSDVRRGRLHHRSSSETALAIPEQEPPNSSERRSSPASHRKSLDSSRRNRPRSRERNLTPSMSPDIVENSPYVPRPPGMTVQNQHSGDQTSSQSPPVPQKLKAGENRSASENKHSEIQISSQPTPISQELKAGQDSSASKKKHPGVQISSQPTPIPDSPPSLPYVVDHRLPAEEVSDQPSTSHTNPASTYAKYHEMTPRIQQGIFSAWLCLPDEILLHIFSYLSSSDLVKCAKTCTAFHRVAMDDSLWRYITVKKKHHLTDESLSQIGKRRPVSLALIQCHGDNINAKGLRDLFRECGEGLRELNISGCSRGCLMGDCVLLHASARCRGLTHVDASWCNVTDSGIGAISGSCDRLESLCINGCQNIKDEGLETVIKKHGNSLRHLEMFGCFNITPKSIRYLGNHCPNLLTLNLGQCYKLTDSCISQLSSSLSRVQNLDLRGCKQIKDNCIRYVVKNCPRLQTITLANCPNITDVAMLEVSTYITDIRNIDVCGCRNITDNSIRALANNCQNLRNIDISSTGCSHRSVSMLANFCNQRLETVKLNFLSDITNPVIIKLAKHCRRLKLIHLYGCTSIRNSSKILEVNPNIVVEM